MKTVLVSGAGSGIGRAIAKKLAGENISLILLGRTEDKLLSTKKELDKTNNHQIVVADVRNKEEIRNGLESAQLTDLYAVVANAGIGGENRYGTGDRWDEVIATNLSGTYFCVNECFPYLKKSNHEYKHIVLISSILARLGVPNYSAYCASKAGMLGLMRSWAAQFARDKILVNAICPGWVETEMAAEGIRNFAKATGKSYEDAFKEQMSNVLLGKMSQPHEIAGLVSYLLSKQQTSITGQTLDINNGASMP